MNYTNLDQYSDEDLQRIANGLPPGQDSAPAHIQEPQTAQVAGGQGGVDYSDMSKFSDDDLRRIASGLPPLMGGGQKNAVQQTDPNAPKPKSSRERRAMKKGK